MPAKARHIKAWYVPDCPENYKIDLDDPRNIPVDLNQAIRLSRRNARRKIRRKKAA